MRLHTDKLSPMHVIHTLQALKRAGLISHEVNFETITKHGSRSRKTGIEVRLIAHRDAGPFLADEVRDQLLAEGATEATIRAAKRRHNNQAHTGKAATWHEWGTFMEAIYEMDHDALWSTETWDQFEYRTYEGPFEYTRLSVNDLHGRCTHFGVVITDAECEGKLDLQELGV